MRTEYRHAQRDQRIAACEAMLQQPFNFGTRMWNFAEMLLTGLRIGLRRTMQEYAANPCLGESVDRAIGMGRRGIVVAPVAERRGAAVELVQGACQRADIQVVGREQRGETRVHATEVLRQRPVRGEPA